MPIYAFTKDSVCRYDESKLALITADLVAAEVVSINERGGGVVRFPILAETMELNLALTKSGSKRRVSVIAEHLHQIIWNFSKGVARLPIHRAPHRPFSETAGPAEGFIEGLVLEGKTIWATCSLIPEVMTEFLDGKWGGFSVDMAPDVEWPAGELPGWSLLGGVLTNRPSIPGAQFRVAATADNVKQADVETISVTVRIPDRGDTKMPKPEEKLTLEEANISLAAALADVENKTTALEAVESALTEARKDNTTMSGRVRKLETEIATAQDAETNAKAALKRATAEIDDVQNRVASLEADVKSERAKRVELEQASLEREVTALIRSAIRAGVQPSVFGNYEKDTLEWFKGKFVSLEGFKEFLGALPKTTSLSAVSSGKLGNGGDDDEPLMDAERAKHLRRLGLDPDLATIGNAADLRELEAKRNESKK